MLSRVVKMSFLNSSMDAGLLFLRVSVGISLFLKHGYEKLFHFSQMAPTFSDPLHLGSTTSLFLAMISDGTCSMLIVSGLGTRWAALYSFIVIFVAWSVRDHFMYFGHLVADHGELSVLYLFALGTIFLTGPGRYSVDAMLKS
jgi:putative oxidoreductase